jgi:hypothetical protein
MAAPNIIQAANCVAKTTYVIGSTVTSNVITNSASSGQLYKINGIIASNINTAAVDVNVFVNRSSVNYYIAAGISVPDKSTLIVLGKDTTLYIEEGDVLSVSTGANSSIHFSVVYEVVS